jgi:hypothetical protein
VITAIEMDNPDADVVVDDQGGYIRIGVPQRCRVTRASLEDALGRSFQLPELEPAARALSRHRHAALPEGCADVRLHLSRVDERPVAVE